MSKSWVTSRWTMHLWAFGMLTHCWQTREIERQRYMQREEELTKQLAQAQAVPQLSSATLKYSRACLGIFRHEIGWALRFSIGEGGSVFAQAKYVLRLPLIKTVHKHFANRVVNLLLQSQAFRGCWRDCSSDRRNRQNGFYGQGSGGREEGIGKQAWN